MIYTKKQIRTAIDRLLDREAHEDATWLIMEALNRPWSGDQYDFDDEELISLMDAAARDEPKDTAKIQKRVADAFEQATDRAPDFQDRPNAKPLR